MTRHDLKRFRDAASGDLVRAWIRRIEAGESPRRAARYLGQSPVAMRGIAALEPSWAEALRVALLRPCATCGASNRTVRAWCAASDLSTVYLCELCVQRPKQVGE